LARSVNLLIAGLMSFIFLFRTMAYFLLFTGNKSEYDNKAFRYITPVPWKLKLSLNPSGIPFGSLFIQQNMIECFATSSHDNNLPGPLRRPFRLLRAAWVGMLSFLLCFS
jgi:hypothetical protein